MKPDRSTRRSTIDVLGLPKDFGTLLLTVALIMVLSPYLSGVDLGVLKVPTLGGTTIRILRVAGPVIFVVVVGLFFPAWRPRHRPNVQPVATTNRDQVHDVSGGVRVEIRDIESVPEVIRVLFDTGSPKPVVDAEVRDELMTVVAELAVNAFKHGAASYADVACLDSCVVIQDDGATFDPLSATPSLTVHGGAGLFALAQWLSRDEQFGAVHIPYNDWQEEGSVRRIGNQVVLFPVLSVDGTRTPSRIRLRAPDQRARLLYCRERFPYAFRIEWRHSAYLLDIEELYRETKATRLLSGENVLVQHLLRLLPKGSILQLRGATGWGRQFYEELSPRLENRIVLVD